MTLSQGLSFFYERGLNDLKKELQAYPDTQTIWKTLPGTSNSGGTLFLHLIGNLEHFVVKGLASTDFVRDRAGEFGKRDVSKQEIRSELDRIESLLKPAFLLLKEELLTEPYPIPWKGGKTESTQFMLNQMAVHLHYHLGQINYHRRFFTSKP
jgi:hypothetical protein